jgi:hypothetical protein
MDMDMDVDVAFEEPIEKQHSGVSLAYSVDEVADMLRSLRDEEIERDGWSRVDVEYYLCIMSEYVHKED